MEWWFPETKLPWYGCMQAPGFRLLTSTWGIFSSLTVSPHGKSWKGCLRMLNFVHSSLLLSTKTTFCGLWVYITVGGMQTNNSPGPKQDPPMNFPWATKQQLQTSLPSRTQKNTQGKRWDCKHFPCPWTSWVYLFGIHLEKEDPALNEELSHMANCVLCHITSEYDPAEHGLKDTDCSALYRVWSIF